MLGFLTVQTRTDVYDLTGLKEVVLHFKILIMPENDLEVMLFKVFYYNFINKTPLRYMNFTMSSYFVKKKKKKFLGHSKQHEQRDVAKLALELFLSSKAHKKNEVGHDAFFFCCLTNSIAL